MNKEKVASVLVSKRNDRSLTIAEMALEVGCNRSTIARMESGTTSIPRTKLSCVARAYGIPVEELAKLCGYSIGSIINDPTEPEIRATIDDLEYLITVARGLQTPMTVAMICDLLKCRQPKAVM